jgi:hypothetical protein
VSPCGQHVSRIGPLRQFSNESRTETAVCVDALHELLRPAFDSASEGAKMLHFRLPKATILAVSDSLVQVQSLNRFRHVFRTINSDRDTATIAVVTDVERDLGVDMALLRETAEGQHVERLLFAHLRCSRGTGLGAGTSETIATTAGGLHERKPPSLLPPLALDSRSLRGVDQIGPEIVEAVLVDLVRARIESRGECTLPWLLRASRWSAVAHLLPPFTQCVVDSPSLHVIGAGVSLRDPREQAALWARRRRSAVPGTSAGDGG